MQCQDFSGTNNASGVVPHKNLNERCFKIDLAFFDGTVKIRIRT